MALFPAGVVGEALPSLWSHRHSHPLRGPCLGFLHLGVPGRVFQQLWAWQQSLEGNPVPELCPQQHNPGSAAITAKGELWALLVTLSGSQLLVTGLLACPVTLAGAPLALCRQLNSASLF